MKKMSITHKQIHQLYFYNLIRFQEDMFAEIFNILLLPKDVLLSSFFRCYFVLDNKRIFHVPDTVVCEVRPGLLYSLDGVPVKEDSLQESEAAGLMEQHCVRGERGLKQNLY